jgi:hypothetical protein
MEYIVEKTQKVKKVGADEKTSIAKKITDNFETYDLARSRQLEIARIIMDEIYFRNEFEYKEKHKQWKSIVKLHKIFMYSQILKAFIWKNIYANTNSMFDVSGDNLEADTNSNKQKTALVDCFEKMEYSKTCDKIIDKSLIYGELISFVTWRKKTEEYRRPISFFEAIKDPSKALKIASAKVKGQKFYIDEKTIYDNAYIYDVDPANFVFDTTQSRRNWETCPKIHRTWRTPDEIISNQYFELTNDEKAELRNLVKNAPNSSDVADQKASTLKDERVNGSTVEVLEHWGDLTLSDGTVLKNWYAVVVAGKFLVQFEKNPLIINPFNYGAFVIDEEMQRGISLLYPIHKTAMTQEDMIRRTMDMQALTENPPVYAGKGFFGDDPDDIEVHPGKIIEYDPQLYEKVPVQPMQFNVTVFQDSFSYLDDLMSEISGIFPNMAGASESERTTATEISTKVEGQLTRLKMLLDVINQNLILADVKAVAKLRSNFIFGKETVFINNDNKPENVEIDDNIRQADYRYTYADRSATSERFNYADMIIQSVQQFLKAGLPLNLQECFTWYMEQKGAENPERFLQTQMTIDPQVQEALLQNPQLAPIIQAMTERVQMAKEGKELPDDAQAPQAEQQAPEEALTNPSASLPGRNLLSA